MVSLGWVAAGALGGGGGQGSQSSRSSVIETSDYPFPERQTTSGLALLLSSSLSHCVQL